jgi:uncharacterized protein (TIGR03546 family)
MVIFAIKLLNNIRTAVAGRKYPHQSAWAVAFGVLLGVVPHGNLLALSMLTLVLALKINHALAAVVAIGTTFLATRLDPFSDQVGNYVLSHPKLGPMMADTWQLPLVPWTDLNNTVVMGSFVIGVAALLPIFMITYPLFRVFAPADQSDGDPASPKANPVRFVDPPHTTAASHLVDHPAPASVTEEPTTISIASATVTETPPEASVDRYLASLGDQQAGEGTSSADPDGQQQPNAASVETRIDVIRMKDFRDVSATADTPAAAVEMKHDVTTGDSVNSEEKPLDEALNYLLRQLRDSQQRKAG